MDANAPEPEPASPDPASDIPSLAELAADHPRALGAQHEGASPRSAERVGWEAMLKEVTVRERLLLTDIFMCPIGYAVMTDLLTLSFVLLSAEVS